MSERPPEDRFEHLERVVGAVGGVVWEFDWPSDRFTFVSGGAEALLGLPLDAWLAEGFWRSRLHPEDALWAPGFCERATREKCDHEFEYRMVRADGSVVWVRDIVTVDPEMGIEGSLRGLLVDVTDRRNADYALQRKLDEFEAVFRAVGDTYIRLDRDGLVRDYLLPVDDDLLLLPDPAAGGGLAGLMPPTAAATVLQGIREARHTGRIVVAEYRTDLADSSREWEARAIPLADGGAAAVVREVTERNRSVRDLKKSQKFRLRLLEMLDSGVLVVTEPDDGVRMANRPAERIFGAEPGDLDGVPTVELFAHAEDYLRLSERVLDRLRADETHTSEVVLRRRDGSLFDAEVSVRVLGGEAQDRLWVIRDVSDRKTVERLLRESEHRFRCVVESAPFGVHLYELDDADGLVLVAANPAARSMTADPDARLLGKTLGEAFPSAAGTPLARAFDEVAREGGVWRDAESAHPDGEGGTRVFDVTAFQTAPRQLAVLFVDVTERLAAAEREGRYAERLSALAAELTSAEERERHRLAEELHDRVSQSLAVTRMHLMAARGEDGACDWTEIAKAEGLVEDAIIETRAVTSELAPPILYELGLGAGLRWLADGFARVHGLEVGLDLTVDRTGLDTDAEMVLFRAARELLMNVVKHSGVRVARVTLDIEEGWVRLGVEDDGRGFDPLEPASRDLGFGLFSIRDRLPHLGGSLEVISRPDAGTKVHVRLPLPAPESS